ncbi:MAG: CBS domain-containing protein [Planctomycetes bacterium]|nr:CBS domain-containing protein [Planctomycetota bacterium]
MQLQNIMKTDIVITHPDESAEGAWELMQMKRCHHLLVVGDAGLEGLISERDLGGKKGEELRKDRKVSDLMTRDVITATPSTTLHEAADMMRGHTIGSLPIMEDGKLCGIITVYDMLKILAGSRE